MTNPAFGSSSSTLSSSKAPPPPPMGDFYGKPFFGKSRTEVVVQEGSHAFFHCNVHNLGNQTVRGVFAKC